MSIITNLERLIPNTEDIYSTDIRRFFITIASLVSNDFMNINVQLEQSKPLTSEDLKKIFDSSDVQWNGPGTITPDIVKEAFDVNPNSALIFEL